jgi:hypothetical protein
VQRPARRQVFVKCEMANTSLVNARLRLEPIDVRGLGRIKTNHHRRSKARGLIPVQQTETTMRQTTLTIFAALLISGFAVQMAAASPHHQNKAYFGRDLSEFRGTYNQVNGPISVAPRAHDRFDPSLPRSEDSALNPPGS